MADKTGYIGRNPGDSSVTIARQTFTPTSDTTSFTFDAGYTVGLLDVYLNGAKLIDATDYDANTGSTVGLTSAAQNGDVVEIVAYKAFNLGQVSSSSGNFTVGSNLSVGSTTTLSGVTTCEGDLYVGGDLYVLDDIVYDEVSGRNLNITGIATAAVIHAGAGATVLSSGNAEFVGIVTSNTCFKVGNGAFGAGIGATITGDGNAVFAGVVTATTFKGDGSSLTGIGGTSDINTNNIQISGISTLGTAAATTLDVAGIATVNANGSQITGVSTFDGNVHLLDNKTLYFGGTPGTTTGDLQLFHDASHSYIRDQGTGDIRVRASGFDVREATNALSILRADASGFMATTGIGTVTRLETTDANVSGIITATQYKGDGSALTGVGGEFDITSCLFV